MNIEKVIKGLDCHRIDNNHRINCADCPYYVDNHIRCANDLHDDAISMLKEQKEEIENLKQTCQSMMEGVCLLKEQDAKEQISDAIHETAKQFRQTIVRCKDCKYHDKEDGKNFCDCGNRPDDWFCAGGRRR